MVRAENPYDLCKRSGDCGDCALQMWRTVHGAKKNIERKNHNEI